MMKLYKKIILLCMVLAITANAAEVNDIDKNAFITKAEFDSLKNQYQSILDKYNSTVEYKVDAAIASYVAGVTMDISHTQQSNIDTYDWH